VFTFSFAGPARWILIALLVAAAGLAAYDFAIAADPVGAQPEGKDSAVAKLELNQARMTSARSSSRLRVRR
jgi:hypothetical protein